jgi:chorismate mutase
MGGLKSVDIASAQGLNVGTIFRGMRLPMTPLRNALSCSLLVVFSHLAGAADAPVPAESLRPLLATLNERLNIGDLVALTKWDSGKPIQDSPREAQVIANARTLATEHQLDPEDVAQLIAAQMEANKLVQYGLLAQWQAAGAAPDTPRPDLAKQIRPRLDELQTRLLRQYADFAPYRRDPNCPAFLAKARQGLTHDALHDLALTRATGELCIRAQKL